MELVAYDQNVQPVHGVLAGIGGFLPATQHVAFGYDRFPALAEPISHSTIFPQS
jgi:hypothetical protein